MPPILSQKRVLVTGAGGFVGANLIRKLLPTSKIHVIWKSSTNPWRIDDIKSQLKLYEVDLLDETSLNLLVKKIKPTHIYHLATHGAYSTQTDVEKMIDINIKATMNLLNATLEIPYKLFVNTGSSSEYGFKNKPMKETDLLTPISFYAATKACATHLCQVFAKQYNKPIITFRLFSVYGPYEEKTRFVPTITRALLNNESIKLTPGKQRRDFIYIDDVVDAYLNATKLKKIIPGSIYNLGTGREYTNDEIIKFLFKVAKRKTTVHKGAYPVRSWDTSHWLADISLSKRVLKWQPKNSLEQGLAKTLAWFIINQPLYEKINS